MADNAKRVFNFGASPLLKGTEDKVLEEYNAIEHEEDQGGGEQQATPTIPGAVAVAQGEPTQNINVPIPISLHSRLAIIKAKTRQNMKDLVVLAINEYVERHELDV